MEELEEKQETGLDEFEERQRRSFARGKLLVYLIVGINIFFDIITILISHEFQFGKFVLHVALSAALVFGVSWVRYLYAISGILTIVAVIMALPELIGLLQFSAGSGWLVFVLILTVGYSAVSAGILLFSKSVQEYMYKKKSERL